MNNLVFHAYPLLQLAHRFTQDNHQNSDYTGMREDVIEKFNTMEQTLIHLNMSQEVIHNVKYCLAAIVDECVLCSCWEQRLQWMGNSLQMQWFGQHLAGREFFSRLTLLQEDFDSNVDIIELYYIALQLGFKGEHRLHEGDKLQRLINQLQYNLLHHCRSDNQPISNAESETSLKKRIQTWLVSAKAILMITIIVNLLIYSIFSIALNEKVQSLNRYFQAELINNLSVR